MRLAGWLELLIPALPAPHNKSILVIYPLENLEQQELQQELQPCWMFYL